MPGTKAGSLKAQATMKKKYGKEYLNFYRKIGQIGGRLGRTGGYASDKVGKDGLTGYERAAMCGSKGGSRSKRGPGSIVKSKIVPNKEKIVQLYLNGHSLPQIAKQFDVQYSTLLRWAKENMDEYGRD